MILYNIYIYYIIYYIFNIPIANIYILFNKTKMFIEIIIVFRNTY